jgi:hypothetical protein
MQMTKKNSIRGRLTLALVALSILPLLLLGAILSWENYTVLLDQATDAQRRLTLLVSNRMSFYIHEFESSLLSVVRTTDFMNMKSDQQNLALSKLLFSAMDKEHRDAFKSLSLLNSKGMELAYVSREKITTGAQLEDRSKSEEFVAPSKAVKPSSALYPSMNEQANLSIKISVPPLTISSCTQRGSLWLNSA